MRQPQFIMITGATTSWINLNEIIRADVDNKEHMILQMKRGDAVRIENRQDIEYIMLMLNSLAELPKPPEGA